MGTPGAHLKCKKVNIAISSVDALLPADCNGSIINCIPEPLKLTAGMDGLALASVSILVKDSNDRAMLRLDNTTSSDNRKISHLVVVNATDINLTG